MRRWPPVRRALGLARGLHMSAKHPTCDVHSEGDVDPRRLDVGLWRAGRSRIDLVGPSHHIGFSRLLASGRRRINSDGASQKRRRVLEWERKRQTR